MPDINDLIEIIRAVDDSPESKCGFDMNRRAGGRNYSLHPCRTACCIGGHAALALGKCNLDPESAVARFGIPATDADAICYPPFFDIDSDHPGWSAKPRHAIRLLERYRDTGEVDWDFAMSEPDEPAP